MHATGFFFEHDGQVYLITARHNLLPTNAADLATGDHLLDYQTTNAFSLIDIYLHNGDTLTVKRVNLFEKQGVLFDEEIDVIGVPIDIDPEEYGYIPWRSTDIGSPDETSTTLDVIGYPGQAFPEPDEYKTEIYSEEISGPYVLNLSNDFGMRKQIGLLGIGIDTGAERDDTDYDGYSGSPILGDGLIGIHCANHTITSINTDTYEQTEHMAIVYWRADALKRLLNIERHS